MKKLFILISLFFVEVQIFGQSIPIGSAYPVPQALGNTPSTLVTTNTLRAVQGIIPGYFSDTTSANLLPYLKHYPGAVIFCSSTNSLWLRNTTATLWVEVGSGGGGGTNIYNSDGTLTGNRTLTGSQFNLLLTDINTFAAEANQVQLQAGNQFLHLVGDTGNFDKRVSYSSDIDHNAFTDHTLVDKDWVQNQINPFDATVDFSVNADPNTGGTTFSPNTPELTTKLYVSTINGSQWTYNGTMYVIYIPVNWSTFGNAGTTPGTNFIGTTDAQALDFRTNNSLRLRFPAGPFQPGVSGDSVLVRNSSGVVFTRAQSDIIGVNIYNSDGTLTGDRTMDINNNFFNIVDGGTNRLSFSQVNGSSDIYSGDESSTLGLNNDYAKLTGNDSVVIATSGMTGDIRLKNLTSGSSTDSVLVWTASTGQVKKRNAADFGGGGGTPAGNFGNLQLNRNGAFATPTSDSLDFESATGLTVKGNITSSTLTSGRLVYAGTSGVLSDDANITRTGSGTIAIGTSATTPLIIGGTGTTDPLTLQSSSNGSATTGAYIDFKPGTTSKMRLLNSGNIGIGTTSPAYLLDVNGTTRISDTLFSKGIRSDFTTATSFTSSHFFQFKSNTYFSLNMARDLGSAGLNLWYSSSDGRSRVESFNSTLYLGSTAGAEINAASGLLISTSLATAYVEKTASYTLTALNFTVNNTSGSNTMTLPTAASIAGRIYTIVNTDAAATVTVATTSSQTFTNVAATPTSLTIVGLGTRQVQSTGAAWVVISTL